VKGICAEPKIANLFSKHYENKSNLKSKTTMKIKGLILDKLNDLETRDLNIRGAANDDYDFMREYEYFGHKRFTGMFR
jgi:hypothetical protein